MSSLLNEFQQIAQSLSENPSPRPSSVFPEFSLDLK